MPVPGGPWISAQSAALTARLTAVLAVVVVDERLLGVVEFGLPAAEEDVFAVVAAFEHGVVERGQHSVDREFGGVHVEPTEVDRFVGCDDDLLAELGDPAEFGVARDGVAVAGQRYVALAEFRDRVVGFARAKLPAIAVDLSLSN